MSNCELCRSPTTLLCHLCKSQLCRDHLQTSDCTYCTETFLCSTCVPVVNEEIRGCDGILVVEDWELCPQNACASCFSDKRWVKLDGIFYCDSCCYPLSDEDKQVLFESACYSVFSNYIYFDIVVWFEDNVYMVRIRDMYRYGSEQEDFLAHFLVYLGKRRCSVASTPPSPRPYPWIEETSHDPMTFNPNPAFTHLSDDLSFLGDYWAELFAINRITVYKCTTPNKPFQRYPVLVPLSFDFKFHDNDANQSTL